MRLMIALVSLAFLVVGSGSAVTGQDFFAGLGGPISGTATEAIQLKPEKLRLVMWVQAKGKDVKSAVTALNEQKAKVKKELETMKAEAESIKFSASRVGADETGNQQRAMVRMSSPGRSNSKPAKPATVFLAKCAVKAEWTLPVSEGDALAILPANLLDQVVSRDLEGKNNKSGLDEEKQEELDEMEAMMQQQYYGGDQNGNGPTVMFVAKVSEDVMDKAIQMAFQKATEDAKRLSKASSIKLGKLSQVSKVVSPNEIAMEAYSRGYMGQNSMPEGFNDTSDEVVTAKHADELFYRVSISVTYAAE